MAPGWLVLGCLSSTALDLALEKNDDDWVGILDAVEGAAERDVRFASAEGFSAESCALVLCLVALEPYRILEAMVASWVTLPSSVT